MARRTVKQRFLMELPNENALSGFSEDSLLSQVDEYMPSGTVFAGVSDPIDSDGSRSVRTDDFVSDVESSSVYESEPASSRPVVRPSATAPASQPQPGKYVGKPVPQTTPGPVVYYAVRSADSLDVVAKDMRRRFMSHQYSSFKPMDWFEFGDLNRIRGNIGRTQPAPELHRQITIILNQWIAIVCGKFIVKRRDRGMLSWQWVKAGELKNILAPFSLSWLGPRGKNHTMTFYDIWLKNTNRLSFDVTCWSPYPPAVLGGHPDQNSHVLNTFRPLNFPIDDWPWRGGRYNPPNGWAPAERVLYDRDNSDWARLVFEVFGDANPDTFKPCEEDKAKECVEFFYDLMAFRIQVRSPTYLTDSLCRGLTSSCRLSSTWWVPRAAGRARWPASSGGLSAGRTLSPSATSTSSLSGSTAT